MIYSLLRFIFRITVRVFFRKLEVVGSEHVPEKGPLFIVANHPSAFMDPIVIGAMVRRRLYFIAKGSAFRSKFAKWILPRFNMIPIYRAEESPDEVHKNEDVFRLCYSHLERGGAILIFPEGISLTDRKIKKIKTGTARMALGAEARNGYTLGVKIVTIGLNFSNPHRFQSDLFMNIDEPIPVSDFYDAHRKDPFKAAHALTDEIRRRMEKQVVAIGDAEIDKLVANIELIYKAQLLRDLGHSPREMKKDFEITRAISGSVHYFYEREPERVREVKALIENYLNTLDRLSLHDSRIRILSKGGIPLYRLIGSFIYLILGFPLFLFGAVNNYLPFRIPWWVAVRATQRPEFYGSFMMTVGTLTFILFYTFQIWLVNRLFNDWRITMAYAALLPLSGFFAFYYRRSFTNVRGNWTVFTVFSRKAALIADLINMRGQIIAHLERGRKEFGEKTENA
ncbi:MAG: lysophospholipid acyltransferase family protein [Bacteroidota bacterium]